LNSFDTLVAAGVVIFGGEMDDPGGHYYSLCNEYAQNLWDEGFITEDQMEDILDRVHLMSDAQRKRKAKSLERRLLVLRLKES
jgi:hypothetical protein